LIGTARLLGAVAAMLNAALMSSLRSRMERWRAVSGFVFFGSGFMLSSATSSPTLNCLNE
jgi:hypothetical protein